jgi:hypothetical protein
MKITRWVNVYPEALKGEEVGNLYLDERTARDASGAQSYTFRLELEIPDHVPWGHITLVKGRM